MASPTPKTDRLREMREDRAKKFGSRIINSLEQAISFAKREVGVQVTVVPHVKRDNAKQALVACPECEKRAEQNRSRVGRHRVKRRAEKKAK